MKSLSFIDVFNPIRNQERRDSKSSLIALSTLSQVKISMLSLFECITCSSSMSLEEIKLIAIIN